MAFKVKQIENMKIGNQSTHTDTHIRGEKGLLMIDSWSPSCNNDFRKGEQRNKQKFTINIYWKWVMSVSRLKKTPKSQIFH